MSLFTQVEFKTFDGLNLRGDFYRPSHDKLNVPIIILTQGVCQFSSFPSRITNFRANNRVFFLDCPFEGPLPLQMGGGFPSCWYGHFSDVY